MEYKVGITPRAHRDLVSIQDYIARENPEAAADVCIGLLHDAYSLRSFPNRGTIYSGLSDIRKLPSEKYLIIFQVDSTKRKIEILRFWHAARDQRRLRLKEESSAYSSTPAIAST
jgi:plasmid stabilization system protein ParE